MKKRIQKLQAIEASGKWGTVEGVLINPKTAHKLLNNVSALIVSIGDLRILCKLINH